MAQADGSILIDTKVDQSGLTKGIKGLTGAAAAAFGTLTGYAIKAGMNFEAQMSKVVAISGAAGDEVAQLTEKAKEMGIATKFSATESAQALEYMAMAGWKTEDMLNGLDGIMNLAAASGEDLALTSDIVTDALTAFGLQAKDAAHFSDVLATASAASNTNVAMLGESFKYVAPVAGAMKYSVEDMAVALGLMANSGIKASQAGTALRSLLSRMAKPTDAVKDAMNALGLTLSDASGNMRPFMDVLMDLRGGFAQLTDAQKTEYAATLAGQEGMSGLLAIVTATDKDFASLTKQINNADGSAKRMAETMNDNLKGQITLLGSSLEGLGLAIYDGLNAPLKEAVKYAISAVNDITGAFSSGELKSALHSIGTLFGKLVELLVKIAKTIIPVFVKALGFIGDKLHILIPLVGGYIAATKGLSLLQSVAKWILAKVAALTAEAAATSASTAATLAHSAAQTAAAAASRLFGSALTFISSPLGAVTLGIGALTAAIVAVVLHEDEETKALNETKKALEEQAEARKALKEQQAENIASGMAEITHAQAMYGELRNLADAKGVIAEKDTTRAKFLAEQLNPVLGQTIQLNKDGTASLLDNAKAIEQNIKKKKAQIVLDAMEPAYKEAVTKSIENNNKVRDLENQVIRENIKKKQAERDGDAQAVKKYTDSVTRKLDELNRLKSTQKGYYDDITQYENAYTEISKGNFDAVIEGYGRVSQAVEENKDLTLNDMALLLTEAQDYLDQRQQMYDERNTELNESLRNAADQQVQTTANQFMAMLFVTQQQGGKVTEANLAVANDILASYKNLPEEQRKTALIAMVNMIDGITDKQPELAAAATMSADEIEESLRAALALDSGTSKPKEIGKKANEDLAQGLEGVANGANSAIGRAQKLGAELMNGLKAGIDKQKRQAVQAAANAVNEIMAKMAQIPKIQSPSKETAKLGRYLMEGLSVGISAETPRTINVVDDNMRRLMAALRSVASEGAERISVQARSSGIHSARFGYAGYAGRTVSVHQTNNFNRPVDSPADVARALERQSKKLAKEIS